MSFAVDSIKATTIPQNQALVTLKIPPEKYDQFQRLFQSRIAEYPLVEFDQEKSVVHFGYSGEGMWMALDTPELTEYVKDSNDVQIFENWKTIGVSSPSKNGTVFEMNVEAVNSLGDKVDTFFQKFPHSYISRQKFNQWLEENEAYHSKEEVSGLKELFEKGDPRLKEGFTYAMESLFNKPFEELQALADTVTVKEEEINPIEFEVTMDLSFMSELTKQASKVVKRLFEPLAHSLNPNLDRIRQEEIDEAVLLSAEGFNTKHQVRLPVIETSYAGSNEAIELYRLKESGFLTEQHVKTIRSLAERGLKLFQRMHENDRSNNCKKALLLDTSDSAERIIKELLDGAPGFCVGEAHDEEDAKKFFIDHMQLLADCGVKALFLENLAQEVFQKLFNDYFTQKESAMPERLKVILEKMDSGNNLKDSPYNYTKLVEASKQANIRILCMENELSRHALLVECIRHASESELGCKRIAMMNFISSQIVQDFQEGKFVILAGAGHVVEELNVPGLAEILGCPSILIGKDLHTYEKVADCDTNP